MESLSLTKQLQSFMQGDMGNVDCLLREVLPILRQIAVNELKKGVLACTHIKNRVDRRTLAAIPVTIRGMIRVDSVTFSIDIHSRQELLLRAISERDSPGGDGFSVPSVILFAASSEV